MNKTITCVSIITLLLSANFATKAQAPAEPQWWFNVELIVFKRTLQPSNTERFSAAIDLDQPDGSAKHRFSNNLLYFKALQDVAQYQNQVNALPLCANIHALEANFDLSNNRSQALTPFDEYPTALDNSLYEGAVASLAKRLDEINSALFDMANAEVTFTCINEKVPPALTQFLLPNVGPRLFSDDSYFRGRNQVLTQDDVVLEDFAKDVFQQRDITPLLYTAWRQEVEFGIDNAQYVRVRAGELLKTQAGSGDSFYSSAIEQNSQIENSDNAFFDKLRQNIERNEPVNWLAQDASMQEGNADFIQAQHYEIEGKVKVYLDYVNQIPYLHLDTAFNHFLLVLDEDGNSELEAFPSKQRRRVISKQIHYFDHPAYGVIMRLERFTPPVKKETQEAVTYEVVTGD